MNNPSEAVATSEGNPEPSPLSIIDVIRAPIYTHTELTSKRKIDSNQPPKGKRRARGDMEMDPENLKP